MSHFQKRIALLKHRSFLAYSVGTVLAAFGNGLGYVALTWLVVSQHNNVGAIAILMACFWGPNILLGPLMGVLADRFSRKWIISISCAIRGALFIGFSVYLSYHFSVTMIYIMMILVGISFSAFYATAFAFVREIISEEDLLYANSTIDIAYEMGNVVGMGTAGIIIAASSAEMAVFINGITFLAATVCMMIIPQKEIIKNKIEAVKMQFVKDFKDGLLYLLQRRTLMAVYTIQLLVMVTFMTTPLLLVPFSKSVLHATVGEFGMIEATASVGIVIGGILMPWIAERFGFMRTILFFFGVLFLVFVFFGFNRSIRLAEVMYFLIGFAGSVWALIITKAQNLTALDYQGRVQSTFNSLSGITMMVFYAGTALLGKYVGISHLYFIEVLITSIAILFLIMTGKVWTSNARS